MHHPITLGGRLTLCQRQYLESLRNPRPNTYTPRCQQNGKFEGVQCEENKCFCVDTESGRMLRDTSLSKLFGEPRCDNKGKKKRIQKEKTNNFYAIITHITNETEIMNVSTSVVFPYRPWSHTLPIVARESCHKSIRGNLYTTMQKKREF